MNGLTGRVVVLTGAGCSVPAGLPLGSTLTKRVVDSFATPSAAPTHEPDLGEARRYRLSNDLLRVLWRITRATLGATATVEDLAYTLDQLRSSADGSYPSPLAVRTVEAIRYELGWEKGELSQNALHADYRLSETVERQLRGGDNGSTSHLAWINEAITGDKLQCLATLNLDTLHEQALAASGRTVSLGFGEEDERGLRHFRWWNDQFLDEDVALLKLHGSVDWYLYNHPSRGMAPARFTGTSPMHVEDEDGGTVPDLIPNQSAETLIGSYNKFRHYLRTPYDLLLARFRQALRGNTLVVLGYSFGDHGINSMIINWMTEALDGRIVVIDPNLDKLESNARLAIQNHWDPWTKSGRLLTLARGSGDFAWTEVAELVDTRHAGR